jgi:hypothetical protein
MSPHHKTCIEHGATAEQLLDAATGGPALAPADTLAAAQVHATLALAAATLRLVQATYEANDCA